jgi:hypothetical protein
MQKSPQVESIMVVLVRISVEVYGVPENDSGSVVVSRVPGNRRF